MPPNINLVAITFFAQEESKNVSDNLKWRARKKFEQGEIIINTTRFFGYDKDEYGDLVVNQEEAEVATVGNTKWHDVTILRY